MFFFLYVRITHNLSPIVASLSLQFYDGACWLHRFYSHVYNERLFFDWLTNYNFLVKLITLVYIDVNNKFDNGLVINVSS